MPKSDSQPSQLGPYYIAGDRGQPSCGWCVRNNQVCEYKERKKPGLRAGYGRELEARLGRDHVFYRDLVQQLI